MSAEALRAIMTYEPLTGLLRWKIVRRGVGPAGSIAGSPQTAGYISVMIDGLRYQAHRLAWYIVTGDWPLCDIDHEDTDGGNNKWINLRLATSQQNGWNRNSFAASGFKGVCPTNSGKWTARIKVGDKIINFPSRVTREEAHADYVEAAWKYHGEFARTT